MTELMRDDALQLRPIESLQGTLCDGHRCVGRSKPGRERVDGLLLLQDEDLRRRRAGGDRHLLDNINQAPAQGVPRVCRDRCAPKHMCDLTAASRQGCDTEETGQEDKTRCDDGDTEQQGPVGDQRRQLEASAGGLVRIGEQCQQSGHEKRHRGHDHHDREQIQEHEHAGRPPRLLLPSEEVHRPDSVEKL